MIYITWSEMTSIIEQARRNFPGMGVVAVHETQQEAEKHAADLFFLSDYSCVIVAKHITGLWVVLVPEVTDDEK